jgi:hypothetical protein
LNNLLLTYEAGSKKSYIDETVVLDDNEEFGPSGDEHQRDPSLSIDL